MDVGARGNKLDAYLFRRLNKMMKTTAAGTLSGFEVFRRIVLEKGPITEY